MSSPSNTPVCAPFGTWKSPITADLIVAESIGLSSIQLDGSDIYWVEMRPSEKGRYVVVRRSADGKTTDVTPAEYNVRTRVHEYGGGAYTVNDGIIYFSNFSDQRIYGQRSPASPPVPFTQKTALRFADCIVDRHRNRLICVCEDHRTAGNEPINSIAAFALTHPISSLSQPSKITTLASGHDFFSTPRLNPAGNQICWLTWNHPNMPWDGTELWLADVQTDGSLSNQRVIAGSTTESIFQPQWSPDGTLYFVSDRTGWWNLYHWQAGQIEDCCTMEAEFGLPHWVFGMSTYAFASADQLICTYIKNGFSYLGLLDLHSKHLETIETPYTRIDGLHANQRFAIFLAGSATEATAIVRYDLAKRQFQTLQQAHQLTLDQGYLSTPQAIEFPTSNEQTAHGFFYAPQNKEFTAPIGERPPLLVMSHGGPTAMATPARVAKKPRAKSCCSKQPRCSPAQF